MSWRSDLKGTLQNLFGIGGNLGVKLKNVSGLLEIRNAADGAYQTARALNIAVSAGLNDIATLLDIQGRVAIIEWSFDGNGPVPSPGDNTGKFGFCHTTGVGGTQGRVYYDTGAALTLMPVEVVKALVTTSAVTGTVSLIANAVYALVGGNWILKGDGNASTEGALCWIKVDYDYTAGSPILSTTAIAANWIITQVINDVKTLFNGTAPTLLVELDGVADTTLMATGDSELKTAEPYISNTMHYIDANHAGVVKLTVTPDSSAAGVGSVFVGYTKPSA